MEPQRVQCNFNDENTAAQSTVNRILVATDTSAAADVAVEHAAEMARAHRAELQVLYVKPPLDPREVFAPDKLPHLEVVEDHLDQMQGRFPDLTVHTSQEIGDLAATICDVAEQSRSDVIVIACPARNGKKRFRPGSLPRRIMRRSPCSVFLVDARTAE